MNPCHHDNTIEDTSNGCVVCTECGLVIDEHILVVDHTLDTHMSPYLYDTNAQLTDMLTTLNVPDAIASCGINIYNDLRNRNFVFTGYNMEAIAETLSFFAAEKLNAYCTFCPHPRLYSKIIGTLGHTMVNRKDTFAQLVVSYAKRLGVSKIIAHQVAKDFDYSKIQGLNRSKKHIAVAILLPKITLDIKSVAKICKTTPSTLMSVAKDVENL